MRQQNWEVSFLSLSSFYINNINWEKNLERTLLPKKREKSPLFFWEREQSLYKTGRLSESCPRKHLLRQYGSVTGFVKDYSCEVDPLLIYFTNDVIPTATWTHKMLIPVAARSKAWFCSRSLAEIVGSNPARAWMSVVSFVCCQVEVSATGWSPVQRSSTDCGVS